MRITGKMVHEAFTHVYGSGLKWADLLPGTQVKYGCMAEKLNPSWTNKIVCLCGSTRFGEAFRGANLQETLAGNIVLSIGCEWHSDQALHLTSDDKERLDELHLRKIDLADEVLVLNVGGYVGSSTAREIAYAKQHGKPIRWLEEIEGEYQRLIAARNARIEAAIKPGMDAAQVDAIVARIYAEEVLPQDDDPLAPGYIEPTIDDVLQIEDEEVLL
jgi:hypothetical protein